MDRKLNLNETTIEIRVGKAFSDLINPNKKNLIIQKIKKLREDLKNNFNFILLPVKISDEYNLENYELQILINENIKYGTLIDKDLQNEKVIEIIISKLKELSL